jgi:hypothetical protein
MNQQKKIKIYVRILVNLAAENLANAHLCCMIRCKNPHPGIETIVFSIGSAF